MFEMSFYIQVVVAILGIAYPILFQVVSKLDEKYNSETILDLFHKEKVWNFFLIGLIASIFSIVIFTLKLKPSPLIKNSYWIIDNSAEMILISLTIILIIVFFFFVFKILKYIIPSKLTLCLINKLKKKPNNEKIFTALSDIFRFSIKNDNTQLSETISRYFYTAFQNVREKTLEKEVIYPHFYYDLVHKSTIELANFKKRNYGLEYRITGGIWLLGERGGHIISAETFLWLWRNLNVAIKYNNDDMILYYWQTAEQYYTYNLQTIWQELDYDNNVINSEIIKKRNNERNDFLEFHYAIGGLLMYKKKYDCLKRIFSYTTSFPPKYELLPDNIDEIFKWFDWFRDPYELNNAWISHKYPFPEQDGLNSEFTIKSWILSYITILLLRQYTIQPYLSSHNPLEVINLPESQGEKKSWINGIDYFKNLVIANQKNIELLKIIGLDFINEDWCRVNGKKCPIEIIDNLKIRLETEYEHKLITQKISTEKVKEFYTSSKNIIEEKINALSPILNKIDVIEDSDIWIIEGDTMIMSKDAFSDESEVHHIDSHSFLAKSLADNIFNKLILTYYLKRGNTYLLKPEDVFKAIDKMNINENFIIICVGVNIQHYINDIKIPNLSANKYKESPLYSFSGTHQISRTFFILNKDDLPVINEMPIKQDIIDKYSLDRSNDNFYFKVIDLNESDNLRNEIKNEFNREDLKKSALIAILFNLEIKWKKSSKTTLILEYNKYFQRGLPNELSDVKQIE